MTVAELKKHLEELPPETEVVIVHSEWVVKKVQLDVSGKIVQLG